MVRWFGTCFSVGLTLAISIGCTSTSAIRGGYGGEGPAAGGGGAPGAGGLGGAIAGPPLGMSGTMPVASGGASSSAGNGGTGAALGSAGNDGMAPDAGAAGEGPTPVEPVCIAGQLSCVGQRVVECNAEGTGYEEGGTDCSQTQTCVSGKCEDHECPAGELFCSGNAVRQCADDGLSSEELEVCGSGEYCDAASAACKDGVCAPNKPACNGNVATSCNDAGSAFLPGGTDCGSTATCDAGVCRPHVCTPNQTFCQGQQVKECASNGLSSTVLSTCTNQTCVATGGDAACVGVCSSGQTRCSGTSVQSCTANGEWGNSQACLYVCAAGACSGECKPGDKRCASGSGVPQRCDSSGVWRNQTACSSDRTCTAGDCLCLSGLTDCSGACVTLSSSSDHCGRCGHSCLGGECESSKCKPVEITAGLTVPSYLAVSATHVYWMDQDSKVGNLRRIPKKGGTVETLYSGSAVGFPGGLDIYNNQLYWATQTANSLGTVTPGFYRANLDGTNRVQFASTQNSIQGVQVVGDIAYWGEYTGSSFTFLRKSVTGTSSPEPLVSGVVSGGAFTWAGNCIYYAAANNTGLSRTCLGSSTGVFSGAVSLGQHSPSDESMIYFGAKGQGLMRLSLTASQAASLVTAGTDVRLPLVDGNFVYFIDGDTGGAPACTTNWGIERSGKTPGSASTVLVPPPLDCPSYLIDDAEALYWLERTVIRKIAKP